MQVIERQTKYCSEIMEVLSRLGHATNSEILDKLRIKFPELSATTVHRATSRLASRNKINIAPPDVSGSIRYDFNTSTHDHFICKSCEKIKDIYLPKSFCKTIENSIDDCELYGSITIIGQCKDCNQKENN